MRRTLTPLAIILLITILTPRAAAMPSGGTTPPNFTLRQGYWYDDWGISRNYAEGRDGYLPQLYSETTGNNRELAYSLGEDLRDEYADTEARAAAILRYIQSWTTYGYDGDNVIMRGQSQDEWAWNADEMAHSIDTAAGIAAVGDCEDLSFLGATMYTAAGIETALVDAPGHVALLIWLPDYPNANQYWELTGDTRGAGWIWVEATGSDNPLGWTPPDFLDGNWSAYTTENDSYTQREPTTSDTGGWTSTDSIDWDLIFFIIFILFIIVSKMMRR